MMPRVSTRNITARTAYLPYYSLMPPKFDATTPENASLIRLFTSLGLATNSATELVRQPKAGSCLKSLIDEYGLEGKQLDERSAGALVKLSGSGSKLRRRRKGYVVDKIVKGDVRSPDQVTGEHCYEHLT